MFYLDPIFVKYKSTWVFLPGGSGVVSLVTVCSASLKDRQGGYNKNLLLTLQTLHEIQLWAQDWEANEQVGPLKNLVEIKYYWQKM